MFRAYIVIIAMMFVLAAAAGSATAQFSISGTAIDGFSAPVANVNIVLSDPSGFPIGIPPTVTDQAGFYSISPLPPGSYVVGFEPPETTRLLAQRVPATITASNVIADAVLDPGFVLSGFVRDSTGVGLFNIDLKIEDRDTQAIVYTPKDNTDSTGFYDVVIPAGRFDIKWRAVALGSLPWIPVEIRDVQIDSDTVIDVTMVLGVFVSGIVRDNLLNPVPNVNLDFIDVTTGVKLDTPGDNTDLLGAYQVQVPKATYDIRVKPLAVTRFQGIETKGVSIQSDTGADFTLEPGVAISGTVTDLLLSGVFNVDLDVHLDDGTKLYTPFSTTDSLGAYSIVVPSGLLDIAYRPPLATLLAPVEHRAVPVSADTFLDVALPPGVVLTGVVTDTAAVGIAGVDIDARDAATGISVPLVGDFTDVNGTFLVVVAPDTYTIEIEPPITSLYVAKQLLSIAALADTNEIAAALVFGYHVSGVVTDSVVTTLAGVRVSAFQRPLLDDVFFPRSKTDGGGFYDVVVPRGRTYDFVFTPDPTSGIPDTVRVDGVSVNSSLVLNVAFPVRVVSGITGVPLPAAAAELFQNYPNPFNPTTTLRYSLLQPGWAQLSVYDVSGALVRVLRSGFYPAGQYAVQWDGTDERGRSSASGVYFYQLVANGERQSRKMLLLK